MIVFQKIRYKNILATGNTFTTVVLNKHKTNLISGSNGSGKSTLCEALVFGLYGKPFRKINKGQLINSINQKELLVEIEFLLSGSKYLVRRGIKPTVFEIWKDGVLLNQDAAFRDYQDHFETQILKLPYKSFTQIVILGSATYTPFMELSPAARRELIEDLLDINIFSTMNILVKEKLSTNKSTLTEKTYEMKGLQEKLELLKTNLETIKKLKSVELDGIKEKIAVQLENIGLCTDRISSHEEVISQKLPLISEKSKLKGRLQKLSNIRVELESTSRGLQKELHFYHDTDNCPTCKQGIGATFKSHTIEEKQTKTVELAKGLEQILERIQTLEVQISAISKIEDEITSVQIKINEERLQIKLAKTTLQNYKLELERAETDYKSVDSADIEVYNSKIELCEKELIDLTTEKELLSLSVSLLKDSGIKTQVVKQYIPIINKLIGSYLAAFELFVDFQLDEQFSETIKSRFRDTFTYASFSEGEKLRINLSILLTWRAISKLRNSMTTNILLLDETLDGPADAQGIEGILSVINDMSPNDNIFVISHRGSQFEDKFEAHLQFEKVKNFSQLKGTA